MSFRLDIDVHPQEESDYNELPTSFRLDIDVQRDCRSSKDSSDFFVFPSFFSSLPNEGGWVVVSLIYQVIHKKSDYNELPTSFRLDIDVQRDCRSSKDSSAERSQAVIDHEHDSPRECQSPKGSSFEKRQVVIDTEQECQSPIPSSIDKNQVEIDCEECETPKFYSVSKFEMDVDGEQELQSPNVPCADVPGAGMAMKGEEYIYVVPQVGVEFESEDHLYNCYSRYAVLEGFSIRKDFVNKSRINGIVVSRRYTCQLEFPEEKLDSSFCDSHQIYSPGGHELPAKEHRWIQYLQHFT